LDEAYARVTDGEIWVVGLHISPYEQGNVNNHDPVRLRKLLLHKREIAKIAPRLKMQGLTLVPTRIFFNERGLAKISIALVKGKRMSDKREDLKTKDAKREMQRAMRRRR
jgi:SsrA-binding protein